jgi:hypothetical protein
MRRIIVGIGLLLAALGSAAAQTGTAKTKSALQTELNNCFPTQLSGFITPLDALTCYSDMLASWQQYPTVNAQTGTTYALTTNDYGKLVTFTNAAPVAVTLSSPATAGFTPWNAYLANLGVGAVTITPSGATINGAASYTVADGNSVWIVSDGTNYQIFAGAAAAVASISNSDGTLTLTPTTGNVVGSLALGHANTWTGIQTFFTPKLSGGGTGVITLTNTNSGSNNFSITIPAISDTLVTLTSTQSLGNKTLNGHLLLTGTSPSIVSCGTGSPSVSGTDSYGTITAGAGTLTTCTINFAGTWGVAPVCVQSSPTLSAMTSTSSTTQYTVGAASLTSATIKFHCGSTS